MEKGSAPWGGVCEEGYPPEAGPEKNEIDEPPGDGQSTARERAQPQPPRWEYLALRGLTDSERRLVLGRVRRAWALWRRALRGGSPEDLLIEAVLELRSVKEQEATRSREAGMGLLTIAIDRRLTRYAIGQLHQRGMAVAAPEPEIEPEEIPALAAEGGGWEAFLQDTLLNDVSEERILAALRTLRPVEMRVLDLWIIEDLTDEQIAARMNTEDPKTGRSRSFTGESVRHRRRLMRARIRAFLAEQDGIEGAAPSHSPAARKCSADFAGFAISDATCNHGEHKCSRRSTDTL